MKTHKMLEKIDFDLSRISAEFLTDQNRFLPFLSKTVAKIFNNMDFNRSKARSKSYRKLSSIT